MAAADGGSAPQVNLNRWNLTKETELRIEVADTAPAYVKLISGNAEIFGIELGEGRTYTLSAGRKLAVFTWYGAELHTWGSIGAVYVSSETQVPVYANLHQRLEARREEAKALGIAGPRVLVVGPTDSGKSSLCRILCAYACRLGRAPTYVDVDIGQGEISIPGTLAASPLDRLCLHVEEGYTQTTPLVYFFGHVTPSENVAVYRNSLQRLADTVTRRLGADDAARISGAIVNTMGWVDGAGYELILDTIRAFQIDVVVVMGHDRVFATLSEDVKSIRFPAAPSAATAAAADGSDGSSSSSSGGGAGAAAPSGPVKVVTVIKLPRPGGVVERSRESRRDARKSRIHEYFYGPDRGPGIPPSLSPEMITVKWDDVTVVKIGGVQSEAGLVPVGKTSALDPLRTTAVTPSAALLNQVLAVSFATSDKQVPHVNVAGFVHVRGVSVEKRTLQLLAPCAGAMPSRYLVLGSLQWVEG